MSGALLEQILSERFGLASRTGWEAELSKAVLEVAAHRGVADAEGSLRVVLRDEGLLRAVAERLTVGESYFYRHPEQLEVVVEHLLSRLENRQSESVTVWSAGCSRGEEPCTLAMMLDRRGGPERCRQVRIIGTDLHGGAIEQAREGRYAAWSLRGISAGARERDFEEVPGGFRIAARFRERVEFVHAPILEHAAVFAEASVDAVVFRNVGIYLTQEALVRVFQAFVRALSPGGLLVLSATDPQPSVGALVRAPELGAAIYRRANSAVTGVPIEALEPRARRESPRRRAAVSGVRDLLEHARELADGGRFDEAIQLLERIDLRDRDDSNAWYLRGQIRLAERRYDEALSAFERSGVLAPSDPTPRFFAAVCLRKLGRAASAVSMLEALELELERVSEEPGQASRRARELLEGIRFELTRLR